MMATFLLAVLYAAIAVCVVVYFFGLLQSARRLA
jgi:hypothetical protein